MIPGLAALRQGALEEIEGHHRHRIRQGSARELLAEPGPCTQLLTREEGRMADLRTTELDLYAFIDGRLADGRWRREVATYLDAHPDAAERVAAYAQQRDVLALLGRGLAPEPSPARLAGLEAALLDAARRRCRARRTVSTADAVFRPGAPRRGLGDGIHDSSPGAGPRGSRASGRGAARRAAASPRRPRPARSRGRPRCPGGTWPGSARPGRSRRPARRGLGDEVAPGALLHVTWPVPPCRSASIAPPGREAHPSTACARRPRAMRLEQPGQQDGDRDQGEQHGEDDERHRALRRAPEPARPGPVGPALPTVPVHGILPFTRPAPRNHGEPRLFPKEEGVMSIKPEITECLTDGSSRCSPAPSSSACRC